MLKMVNPINSDIIDSNFGELIKEYYKKNEKYTSILGSKTREQNLSYERLYKLIKDNFEIDQNGKYFKRWSALSNEKKNERIYSYCVRRILFKLNLLGMVFKTK